jgi:hypothetical protein
MTRVTHWQKISQGESSPSQLKAVTPKTQRKLIYLRNTVPKGDILSNDASYMNDLVRTSPDGVVRSSIDGCHPSDPGSKG